MKMRVGRLGRAVLSALTVTGLLLTPASPATAAPLLTPAVSSTPIAHASGKTSDDPVSITIQRIDPQVVRPGDTFTVRARLTNTSTSNTFTGSAVLSIERVLMRTRSSVAEWATAATTDPAGSALDATSITLKPGHHKKVTLSASASALGLLTSSAGAGPRGIAVTTTGTLGAVQGRTGAARSFVLWQPTDEEAPVDISVLVPFSAPLSEADTLTAAGGRLERALSATEGIQGLTYAVDPALVLATRDGTDSIDPGVALDRLRRSVATTTSHDDGDDDATQSASRATNATSERASRAGSRSTTTASTSWSQRLTATTAHHETWALPLFDTDTAVVAGPSTTTDESGVRRPLLGDDLTKEVAEVSAGWMQGLTLPALAAPGPAALEAAVRDQAATVVARSGYAPTESLGYTPTGVTTVATSEGDATVLVADPTLNSLLRHPGRASTSQTSPTTARQRILAELAVISGERPAEHRSVLIALPRTWSPRPQVARAQLQALGSSPWGEITALSTLQSTADPGISRTVPDASSVSHHRKKAHLSPLTGTQWQHLLHQDAALTAFAEIVPAPERLYGPVGAATLALASRWYEADPSARADARDQLEATATAALGSQSVVIGSDVNLISSHGSMPITVRNLLDQQVSLSVRLVPDDRRLSATPVDGTEVPARSEAQVEIPVRAVGSGDVRVDVELLGPSGKVISTPATFQVRVRADWENVGTAAIAGVLLLLLIGGVWRTVRRGRGKSRTVEGPGDTTPEAQDAEVDKDGPA